MPYFYKSVWSHCKEMKMFSSVQAYSMTLPNIRTTVHPSGRFFLFREGGGGERQQPFHKGFYTGSESLNLGEEQYHFGTPLIL